MNVDSIFKNVKQVILIIFAVIDSVLLLRVVLKIIAAGENAPFVQWLYSMTQPLVAPFAGMFPSQLGDLDIVIEFSTLFGIVMYSVLAYLILYLIDFINPKKST